jgi:hypothetical protein
MPESRSHRFKVGLSFPGVLRQRLVRPVSDILAMCIDSSDDRAGKERILFDHYHKDEFAVPRLIDDLPELYREQCELVVVFLCKEYLESDWCGLEWAQIKLLAKNQRRRIYHIWHGDKDETILEQLDLSWKVDGFRDITDDEPVDIAKGILKRLQDLEFNLQGSITKFIPPAICHPKPLSTQSLCLLAVILLPSKSLENAFTVLAYFSNDSGNSYGLIDLAGCNDRLRLNRAKKDWKEIAQAIVYKQNQCIKAGALMQVEVFLPIELLARLESLELLEAQCALDKDGFVKCSFAACCPIVIRPLDRYYRKSLFEKIGLLKDKFDVLCAGNGKWIYGKNATTGSAIISLRESPEHVAVRLIENFPNRSGKATEWLANLIASMVPVALWWSGSDSKKTAPKKRHSHLGSYISPCGSRHLLDVGNEGRAHMSITDLDHLPVLRRYCSHLEVARSLVLFIDNPSRVPDIPVRDPDPMSCARKPFRRSSL